MFQKLLKIPKSECPDIWIRLPKHKWPKSWSSMEDPVVPLERNLYGHPWAGLLWERHFEKVLLKTCMVGKKFQIGNALSLTEKKTTLICVCGRKKNWAERSRKLVQHGKLQVKDVDLGEPTSIFDHVYLGCTQREHQKSKDVVENYKSMFESRISAGAMEKLPEAKAPGESETNTISSCSYDMEGHAKKRVERYCELVNKTTEQLYKVATPCLDDRLF